MKSNDWWKTTFGQTYLSAFGPIYSPERTKMETNFLMRRLRLTSGDRILDLACGQGRHSVEFAKRGMDVNGVDFSSVLLREARKNAKRAHVDPTFLRGDMRHLDLGRRFDTVVILGNAFGYFDDSENEQVLAGVSKHLKKRGKFVLDLPNSVGMFRNLITKTSLVIPDGNIDVESTVFDPATCRLSLRWTVRQGRRVERFDGRLRLYTVPEITRLLSVHRLRVSKIYGSFDGQAFSLESPRCLMIVEKI